MSHGRRVAALILKAIYTPASVANDLKSVVMWTRCCNRYSTIE